MKRILAMVMVALFLAPSVGMSFENMKKHTKVEKDKAGGYSETQKDYKKRTYEQGHKKEKGGYYEGEYHNQSPEFKQGDYQFVKSGKRTHSNKKSVKKVK